METFIFVSIALLVIFALAGGAITFSWLCGMFAGRAVGWALKVDEPNPADDKLSSQRMLRERAQELRDLVQDMEIDRIIDPGKYSAKQLRTARAKANRADRAAMVADAGE